VADVLVVLDSLSAQENLSGRRGIALPPRFQFDFTPTYASWRHLVERFVALLTEEALDAAPAPASPGSAKRSWTTAQSKTPMTSP